MSRQRLGRNVALFAALDSVAVAAIAGITAYSLDNPWVIAAVTLAGALLLAIATLRRPLHRIDANLGALRDGARGFADGDFSLRLRMTGDDEITDLVQIYNEVGDQLRAERHDTLQRELLFETVLQATPLALVLTTGGRIMYANRAARDVFAGGEHLEGRRFGELLDRAPDLRDAFAAERDALFTTGGEQYHLSHRTFHLNARPHELWIANRLTPEVRRQEVEVWKRAIRMMSHELNNSLAPIRSLFHSARIIRNREDQWHRMDEITSTVEERLDYLQRFLDGYAAFARLPKPRRDSTAWLDVLRSVQQIVEFRIGEPQPSHRGDIDRAQVEQLIINLVKNAAEARSAAEEITVSVERRPGGSLLVVSDRGEGMSEQAMTRAVLPFWSTKSGGSGLGLPLCNDIVEGHGGHLRIATRAGGGTVVSCWFPDSVAANAGS
ncbi:MAG TPA: ATP-binding protein [Thermoanaerobaculia bacterium]|nr:ATP-binding protein [Thermoanaerobaculia bacterium]